MEYASKNFFEYASKPYFTLKRISNGIKESLGLKSIEKKE